MHRAKRWWTAAIAVSCLTAALVATLAYASGTRQTTRAEHSTVEAVGIALITAPSTDQAQPVTPDEEPAPTPTVTPPAPTVRVPIVVIDPGHGGSEVGAVHRNGAGTYDVVEKDVNLEIALRLASLLEADGDIAVLTRTTDAGANEPAIDRNGDGRVNSRDDLQARVDKANEARADLFISIHNNGSSSPWESGTEIWYSPSRTFGDKNLTLAQLAQSALVNHIAQAGYRSVDRGIKDDTYYRIYNGRPFNLFVLGPARGDRFKPRATEMPGILGESLFVSNDSDAAYLQREYIQQAIAEGYEEAISSYFATYPVTAGAW